MWAPHRRDVVALLALLDLAVAAQADGTRWVKSSSIAERHAVPSAFLEQIVHRLCQLGYVRTRRGPAGGVQLAQSPAQIRLGAVLRGLTERSAPVERAASLEAIVLEACARADAALVQSLDETTLEQLIEQASARGLVASRKSPLSFDI